jgi:hypothetical protein
MSGEGREGGGRMKEGRRRMEGGRGGERGEARHLNGGVVR